MSRYRLFSVLTLGQLKLRLKTLLDKKKVMQSRGATASKISASFIILEEGFQQFNNDLNKLQVNRQAIDIDTEADCSQQFVEVNATAFSKILKKVSSLRPLAFFWVC